MIKNISLKKIFFAFTPDVYTKKDIGAGLAITSFAMIGIFIISILLGLINVTGFGVEIKSLLYYTGLTFVAAGYEEIIYRLILLSLLIKLFKNPWIALLFTSVVFGLMHSTNDHATTLSVISNGLGGAMYGIAYILTRKIWLPWALHFTWNYVQAPILGFPVSGFDVASIIKIELLDETWLSGGLYGPEGGIVGVSFRFVVIALILLWVRQSRGSTEVNLINSSRNMPN